MNYRDILICPHQSALTWKVHPLSPCPAITELEAVYARHGQAQAHLAESGRISTHVCVALSQVSGSSKVAGLLLPSQSEQLCSEWVLCSTSHCDCEGALRKNTEANGWDGEKYFRFSLKFPYLCCSEHSKSLQGCLVKKEYTQNMCA